MLCTEEEMLLLPIIIIESTIQLPIWSLSLSLSLYLCNWPISDVHFIISIFSSLLPVCRAEGVEAGRPYGQCECLESLLPSGGVGGGGGQLLETNWSEWSEEVAGEEEDTHFNSSPLYFYFSLSNVSIAVIEWQSIGPVKTLI